MVKGRKRHSDCHREKLLSFFVEHFVIQESNKKRKKVSLETIIIKISEQIGLSVEERELKDFLAKKGTDPHWVALLDRMVI